MLAGRGAVREDHAIAYKNFRHFVLDICTLDPDSVQYSAIAPLFTTYKPTLYVAGSIFALTA